MRTGNLISPSHSPSLPPWPQSAVLFPFTLGGLRRRVAVGGSAFFCPADIRGSSVLSAPATPVVPRLPPASRVGSATTALNRFQPCLRFVLSPGTQTADLRSNAASLLHTVCAMLSSIMLLPSPAPNPPLNPVPFGHWALRDKAAQRRLALR